MGVDVALVADDLTGALDAAAPFAGRGFGVRVYRHADSFPAPAGEAPGPERAGAASPLSLPPRSGPAGSVVAVSTSTRHLAPAVARTAVTAAARRLQPWSPRLLFKKIDSTLRGPVPEEVAALMEVFGLRTAIVCPAFPDAGRIVRGGEVFVHGEALGETEYARDLRTPSPSESMAALLGRIGATRKLRPDDLHPEAPLPGVAIADAETDADLARLAAFVSARPREILSVGSDGLAAGLASVLGAPAPPVRLAGGQGRIVLFALGSRTATTADQAERLRRANPDTPVLEAPGGALDAGAVARAADRAPTVVARIPAEPRGAPGEVVQAFADGIRTAVERLGGPGHLAALVATGGDTVEAILDAFGVGALDVLGEFRPGVPVSRAAGGRSELVLVSKAGGFGTPDLFTEVAAATVAR